MADTMIDVTPSAFIDVYKAYSQNCERFTELFRYSCYYQYKVENNFSMVRSKTLNIEVTKKKKKKKKKKY